MTSIESCGLSSRLEGLGLGPIPEFSEAHVLAKPLDIARSYLADILRGLMDCDPVVAYESIQWPNDIDTADLMVLLPKLSRATDPRTLAADLTKRFPKSPLFSRPFAAEVHLRFMFWPKTLPRLLLPYIDERKESYGRDLSLGLHDPTSPSSSRKTLVVEFSSPNIASEFHNKHLRSTILGAYIANLYQSMGWDVVKLNYLGDWGKQIGLLGAGWERFGSEEQFQTDPLGHMLRVYNQIDELFQPEQAASRAARDKREDTAAIEKQGIFAERNDFFKRMEDGDEKTLALWRRFREASIDYYHEMYASLNVSFDDYSGESQVKPETMDEIEALLKSKNILEESEGSWLIDLKKHTSKPGRVLIRDRNGSRTYHLREMAAVLERSRKYNFDKMIFVVADDHDLHFPRIIKIFELLEMKDLAQKLHHVHFSKGHVLGKVGHDQMLGDILEQSQCAMHDSLASNPKNEVFSRNPDAAVTVGISSLLAQELGSKRGTDHGLDINKMVAFKRGTGPELQYWYARVCLVVGDNKSELNALGDEQFEVIEEEKYTALMRILTQYPDVTALAYRNLEPATIMTFLVNVTDQVEVCLEDEDEEGDEDGVKKVSFTEAEIALFEAVRQVLENAMTLLGIKPAV